MHTIDWLIMGLPILIVSIIGLFTRRYVRSVADFMAGGRNAGRYLLCIARSEMAAGAALFVAMFERFSKGGFAFGWWNQIMVLVGLFAAISGFVVYRYRQTRALTLAQFFEMRYSRKFRIFAGILGFLAGIINFGVIPAVGARFFVYFLQLPATFQLFSFELPTYVALMALFLGTAMVLTTTGGQITVLVTDCCEGMLSQIFYVGIAVTMIFAFSWTQTREVLLSQPKGQSLVNPFDTFSTEDFNLWYVLMMAFLILYGTMAWQNSHAFNSSAASPHDARMGIILGQWRVFAGTVMVTILAVCTLTYLQHPDFSADAARINHTLGQIEDPRQRDQMHWPIALSHLLPTGIKGMLACIILMGVISGDGMHLHSWGSILIQDVVVPLRKRPLSTRQHLLLLRMAILGVAAFAFCFGAMFQQTDKLLLWWAVTQAIYVGGAGAAIIGGLYWSRGTTAGAWAGLLTGSILSVGGIILRQLLPEFPLNGLQISFFGSLAATIVYVAVSVLTCRQPHNMDRLLHRGPYAVENVNTKRAAPAERPSLAARMIGIDGNFTRGDRWVAMGIFGWSVFWFAVFVIGSLWYLLWPWSDSTWALYWRVTAMWMPLLIGLGTTIWFTIGCIGDLRRFIRRLRAEVIDEADDGRVEAQLTPAQKPAPRRPVEEASKAEFV